MNADSLSLESWDEFASGRQLDSWQLADDLAKLDAITDDFASGLPVSNPLNSFSRNSNLSSLNIDESDALKRFQTPTPHRCAPTPLDDLYIQSMNQAEVNSSDWTPPTPPLQHAPSASAPSQQPATVPSGVSSPASAINQLRTDSTPSDFDITRYIPENESEAAFLSSNISIRELSEETEASRQKALSTEEQINASVPQLKSNDDSKSNKTTKRSSTGKAPVLFYLGIALSICGIGLVFGAQILNKVALVNPGKAMIIAGVSGIMVSGISGFLGSLFHRAKA